MIFLTSKQMHISKRKGSFCIVKQVLLEG